MQKRRGEKHVEAEEKVQKKYLASLLVSLLLLTLVLKHVGVVKKFSKTLCSTDRTRFLTSIL